MPRQDFPRRRALASLLLCSGLVLVWAFGLAPGGELDDAAAFAGRAPERPRFGARGPETAGAESATPPPPRGPAGVAGFGEGGAGGEVCTEYEAVATHKVSVCWSAAGCEGTVRISRARGCYDAAERVISNDPATDAALKRKMGPDFYRVKLVGRREVYQDVMPAFSGDSSTCLYTARVEAAVRGHYNVGVELLYENYDGVDEVRNVWPPLVKRSVLKNAESFMRRSQEAEYHQGQLAVVSDELLTCEGGTDLGAWPPAGKPPSKTVNAVYQAREIPDSPTAYDLQAVCGRGARGRWTPRWVAQSDAPLYTKVRARKVSRKPVIFEWIKQRDRDWVWLTCGASKQALDLDAKKACLKGKKVVVIGDSQLRAAYFGLVNVLLGLADGCVRNISSPNHEAQSLFMQEKSCQENVKGTHRHRVPSHGIDLSFHDDAYVDKCGKHASSADVLVLGFGQHPASKKHWPLSRFNATMQSRAQCLRTAAAARPRASLVWLMAPKYPDTQTGYPVGVKDWRTDPRMLLFNDIARHELRQAPRNVHVVEAFDITAPMGHTSSDQAHYNNFVLHGMVKEILDAACP
ncbi:hypothetical protein DIPPA_20624 [Diplonema papillatum]|nr:hypothetical protein DIPPA_20624 [Diplonema papillatum]